VKQANKIYKKPVLENSRDRWHNIKTSVKIIRKPRQLVTWSY